MLRKIKSTELHILNGILLEAGGNVTETVT